MSTDSGFVEPMPEVPPATVPSAVRAQLLATEHWSLLGTRSMTWAEVMGRIGIHLTIASASLVVLALVAQASGFGTAFHVLSIGLASAVLVLGTLTGVRVLNASVDDAALVIGMNRIRAAYVSIDPTLADYFVASWHDDATGIMRTYTLGNVRHPVSHIIGSTNMFMNVVNAIVAGILGALVANTAGGGPGVTSVAGFAAGFGYLLGVLAIGRGAFAQPPIASRFPTPTS